MSDSQDAPIDPRFDPAFQRGFDQTIPVEEYVPERLPRKTAAPAPTAAAEPASMFAPAPVAPASETIARSDNSIAAPIDPLSETDAAASARSDAESDSSPSRNPFLLFLAVISIALVAVGIWLFVRSGDAFNSKDVRSQGDYMSLDATIHMAPFIALLGAATAIGVVFVFASKWRRRS